MTGDIGLGESENLHFEGFYESVPLLWLGTGTVTVT